MLRSTWILCRRNVAKLAGSSKERACRLEQLEWWILRCNNAQPARSPLCYLGWIPTAHRLSQLELDEVIMSAAHDDSNNDEKSRLNIPVRFIAPPV
jgi:hypothetical protein